MKHPGGRPRKPLQICGAIPDRPFLTVGEVCEMTGLHKETIQARLRDGSLQAKKLGGTWRIYRSNFAPSEKVDVDLNIERE